MPNGDNSNQNENQGFNIDLEDAVTPILTYVSGNYLYQVKYVGPKAIQLQNAWQHYASNANLANQSIALIENGFKRLGEIREVYGVDSTVMRHNIRLVRENVSNTLGYLNNLHSAGTLGKVSGLARTYAMDKLTTHASSSLPTISELSRVVNAHMKPLFKTDPKLFKDAAKIYYDNKAVLENQAQELYKQRNLWRFVLNSSQKAFSSVADTFRNTPKESVTGSLTASQVLKTSSSAFGGQIAARTVAIAPYIALTSIYLAPVPIVHSARTKLINDLEEYDNKWQEIIDEGVRYPTDSVMSERQAYIEEQQFYDQAIEEFNSQYNNDIFYVDGYEQPSQEWTAEPVLLYQNDDNVLEYSTGDLSDPFSGLKGSDDVFPLWSEK